MSPIPERRAQLGVAFTDELMAAWSAGMCDGLEMAATMAQALADRAEASNEERGVLAVLRSALKQSGLELAAQGRTR